MWLHHAATHSLERTLAPPANGTEVRLRGARPQPCELPRFVHALLELFGTEQPRATLVALISPVPLWPFRVVVLGVFDFEVACDVSG